jgi:hypothetical protein
MDEATKESIRAALLMKEKSDHFRLDWGKPLTASDEAFDELVAFLDRHAGDSSAAAK